MSRVAFVFAVVGVLSVSLAAARAGRGDFGPGEGGGLGRLLGELAEELDEETRAAVREILEQSREERIELRELVRDHRLEIHDLLAQDAPDEATLMAEIELRGEARTALRKHRVQTLLRVRGVLSPEEREHLRGLMRRRMEEHRGSFRGLCGPEEG
jgi:Spy/CpxP family protein refolding chaperone